MARFSVDLHELPISRSPRVFPGIALGITCFLALTLALAAQTNANPFPAPTVQSGSLKALPPPSPSQLLKDGHYILQKGDEVTVKVFGYPQLEETVKVQPDGRLSVLLANDLEAGGRTVDDLRTELTKRYSVEYVNPRVSVIMRSFANLKLYVGGEVEHPGLFPIAGDISALGAVVQAGGFRITAKTDSVILIRNNGHDQPLISRLDLNKVLKGGSTDVQLQSFDVIYVPKSWISRLDRFVDEFRQAVPLTLTGGFTYLLGNNASVIRFQ